MVQIVACLECGAERPEDVKQCKCEYHACCPVWLVISSTGVKVGEVAGWDHRDAVLSVKDAPEFDYLGEDFTVLPKTPA